MEKFKIFDPTIEVKEQTIAFVPRPPSLQKLRIGLVENTKFNSDKLLLKIAAILENEYGAQSHILRRKRTSGSAVDQEVINEFTAQCDVAVAGVGD
jgi:hypothetical protein